MYSSSSVFSPRSLSGADLPFGRARAIKRAPRGKQAVENGLSSFFYYYYYHRLLKLHSLLPWWSGVGEYKPPPLHHHHMSGRGLTTVHTPIHTHTRTEICKFTSANAIWSGFLSLFLPSTAAFMSSMKKISRNICTEVFFSLFFFLRTRISIVQGKSAQHDRYYAAVWKIMCCKPPPSLRLSPVF